MPLTHCKTSAFRRPQMQFRLTDRSARLAHISSDSFAF
jgi:hypothetical protein